MGPWLAQNSLFRNIYCFFSASEATARWCTPAGEPVRYGLIPHGGEWLGFFVTGFTIVFLLANALLLMAMVQIYLERRLIGRFQSRLGPNRVGPFGLLQPVADAIKVLFKEDIRPREADPIVFNIAPVAVMVPLLLTLAVLPVGKNTYLADLNVGVLYLVAVGTVTTLAVFMGGWASGNRYALFGAMRAVAVLISYEVPMVLALVGVLLLAGSMSLVEVVEAQRLPFLLLQPIGFAVFFAAGLAEINRAPFDLLEAESELVAGYHTEYSGMKFGLFMLEEFAAVVVNSAVIVTLFLKGWENPFVPFGWPQVLPSQLWFLLKVLFLMAVFIWIRATLPRLRIDQVMAFAWKFLFPLAVLNIFLTGLEVLVWPRPTTWQLWAMAGVNWAVLAGAVVLFSNLLARNLKEPTRSVVLVRMALEVR